MTHHNQLKQDLYLRISFELYLKRLLVGVMTGLRDRRDFRNEGVSYKHNPNLLSWNTTGPTRLFAGDGTDRNMIAYVCDQVLGRAC